MECCDKHKNNIPNNVWNIIKKLPFYRYFKQPVDNVSELYEIYEDGLEKYSFSYVYNQNAFYRWSFETKSWERIGISMEDSQDILKNYVTLEYLKNILANYIQEAPKNGKGYIRKNGTWVEGVEEAPDDGQRYCRKNKQWVVCNCDQEPPKPNTYAIDYQSVDGTTNMPADGSVTEGGNYTISNTIPIRAGYIFNGWYATGGGQVGLKQPGDVLVNITARVILEARWDKVVIRTITYDADGGTGAPSPATVEDGGSHTIPNIIPSKAGFFFDGWMASGGGQSGVKMIGDTMTNITGNVTLTAQWVVEPVPTYTITFDVNGGSPGYPPEIVDKGWNYVIPNFYSLARPGYILAGWLASGGGQSGIKQPNDTLYNITGNVTLTAQWTAIPVHTITYDANGGTGAPANGTVNSGGSYQISNSWPTRDGYWFESWTASGGGQSGQKTPNEYMHNITGNVTLTAKWRQQTPVLTVNPESLSFSELGESKGVSVGITINSDEPYSILSLPDWLTVSGKTQSGFTLTASPSSIETNKTGSFLVRLDNYNEVQKTISVSQEGAWLSEFIFKVKTTQPNETAKLCNMGAISLGEAIIEYGDGQIETVPIPQYTSQTAQDPAGGGTMEIYIGTDFTHTYAAAGERTVRVKARHGVNGFRFTTLDPSVNNEWYNSGDMNDHVTEIIKVKSDYILNASRMFAGVRYGWFRSDFVLETPNINKVDYMFEFFGVRDININFYDIDNSLTLPETFWNRLANKTTITSATRMYNGSGFLKVTRSMLGFSTVLTSVIETFRCMTQVGNNWSSRSGVASYDTPILEEFVETDVFWDNPNISNFNGCFWWLNDFYGNYAGSGFDYVWTIRADIFKGNKATSVDVSWMFRQANRAVVEVDFFRHIRNTVTKMDGIFWGSFNRGRNCIGNNSWLFKYKHDEDTIDQWADRPSVNWINSPFNCDYRGTNDLNLLIPLPLPKLTSMVCAFGWRFGSGASGDDVIAGMRGRLNGMQALITGAYGTAQYYNTDWRSNEATNWTHVYMPNINLTDFLNTKCPNVTLSSGKHPLTGATVDGAFACFWDFAMTDENGTKKASDYNTLTRISILAQADMVGWDWGVSI